MAAIDDVHQEPGMGAFVRLAVQNAINGKIDDDQIHDHFARVTGHDPEKDWNNFPRLLTQAFQGEEKVGEMVHALGFHEDNFAKHFELLKDDKQATSDLREEIHEAASFVGESIAAMVDNVRAATKDDASAAYDAAYDFADNIHATHAMHDNLVPDAAHSLSQNQLKNYRSPVTFLKPAQIGGIFGSLKRGARKTATFARKGVSRLTKAVVPRRVRSLFGPENSSMVIGGRDSIRYLHIEPNQMAAISFDSSSRNSTQIPKDIRDMMTNHELSAEYIKEFGVSPNMSLNRRAKITGSYANFAEYALLQNAYYGAVFSPSYLRVTNTTAVGRVVVGDGPITTDLLNFAKPSSFNVYMYHDRNSVIPAAFGAIFTLPGQSQTFQMIPGKNVKLEIQINVEKDDQPSTSLDYVVDEKNFNPTKRRPIRMASLIGTKLDREMHDRLVEDGYVEVPDLGEKSMYAIYVKDGIYYTIDNNGMITGEGVDDGSSWNMFEEKSYNAFSPLPIAGVSQYDIAPEFDLSSSESYYPENDDGAPPPIPSRESVENTSRESVENKPILQRMKEGTVQAIQIKKRDAKFPIHYPWIVIFVSRPLGEADTYKIEGVMLVSKVPPAHKAPITRFENMGMKGLEKRNVPPRTKK